MNRLMLRVVLMAMACIFTAYVKAAPSYDCLSSNSSTEKAICESLLLSHLDELMYEVYQPVARTEKQIQRIWLKKRNQCGPRHQCLIDMYSERMMNLHKNYTPSNLAAKNRFSVTYLMNILQLNCEVENKRCTNINKELPAIIAKIMVAIDAEEGKMYRDILLSYLDKVNCRSDLIYRVDECREGMVETIKNIVDIMFEFAVNKTERNGENMISYKGVVINPVCFQVEWASSDNIEEYEEKYEGFDAEFVGKHWGVEVPIDKLNASWGGKVGLVEDLIECSIYSISYFDGELISGVDSLLNFEDGRAWEQYKKISVVDNEYCRDLLPGYPTTCRDIYLVRKDARLDTVYGVFSINEIDGRIKIIPIYYFDYQVLPVIRALFGDE